LPQARCVLSVKHLEGTSWTHGFVPVNIVHFIIFVFVGSCIYLLRYNRFKYVRPVINSTDVLLITVNVTLFVRLHTNTTNKYKYFKQVLLLTTLLPKQYIARIETYQNPVGSPTLHIYLVIFN
jgi:hypothetical protein